MALDKQTFIELTAELADKMVNIELGEHQGIKVYEILETGDEEYTETAQEAFNRRIDEVYAIFAENGLDYDQLSDS
tara:strand:- start:88 stop:315 length:228 start_codon:yes stop_codon:yes gene_type:complete